MPFRPRGFILLLCAAALTAQTKAPARFYMSDRDNEQWSQKTGLTIADIRAIRIAAGETDKVGFIPGILNLDLDTLKQRNHILFVDGPCVKLHVLERTAAGFTEIWSLTSVPTLATSIGLAPAHPGRGICPQAERPPNAHATPDGRIVLEVPIRLDPTQRTISPDTYSFTWDGKKYQLDDTNR